jgi:hypothetical protein
MENVVIYSGHLEYWVWPLGIFNVIWQFCSNLVYFSPALVYCTKTNLATLTSDQGLIVEPIETAPQPVMAVFCRG